MDDIEKTEQAGRGNPKPKQRPKPNPGAHPITQKVVMNHTPGEEGAFAHDTTVIRVLSETLTSRFHPKEEQASSVPQSFDAFRERMYRFVCMLMAKKLSTSLSEDQSQKYGGALSSIAKVPVSAPSAIIQVIDLFGSIDHEKSRFSMIGQPIIAFTYFARAVEDDIEDYETRQRMIYINLHWSGMKRQLFEYCVGVVNAWAHGAPSHIFEFPGNVRLGMGIPQIFTNMAAYMVFVQQVPKSPEVLRHMQIASYIENLVQGDGLTPAQINDLRALGVGVVNWTSATITGRCERYTDDVEARVRMAFATGSNWVRISMMKTTGSGGQLLQKGTESFFHCPILLGGDTLDLGWLVAGSGAYVRTNPRACYMVPPITTRQGMVGFIEGMLK